MADTGRSDGVTARGLGPPPCGCMGSLSAWGLVSKSQKAKDASLLKVSPESGRSVISAIVEVTESRYSDWYSRHHLFFFFNKNNMYLRCTT